MPRKDRKVLASWTAQRNRRFTPRLLPPPVSSDELPEDYVAVKAAADGGGGDGDDEDDDAHDAARAAAAAAAAAKLFPANIHDQVVLFFFPSVSFVPPPVQRERGVIARWAAGGMKR